MDRLFTEENVVCMESNRISECQCSLGTHRCVLHLKSNMGRTTALSLFYATAMVGSSMHDNSMHELLVTKRQCVVHAFGFGEYHTSLHSMH